jgi:hypothetical protein
MSALMTREGPMMLSVSGTKSFRIGVDQGQILYGIVETVQWTHQFTACKL